MFPTDPLIRLFCVPDNGLVPSVMFLLPGLHGRPTFSLRLFRVLDVVHISPFVFLEVNEFRQFNAANILLILSDLHRV